MLSDRLKTGIRFSEQFIKALGTRYGFREQDYSLVWDGAHFEPSRGVHELAIATADGRKFVTHVDDATLARQDAWKYFRDIDQGFMSLARRIQPRGI
jgi:hypothetical protein